MNTTIKATQSNDATRLKTCIAQYALPNPYKPASLDPPIINANGRAEMGLNHPILAQWLCPADQLERFDENPEQYVLYSHIITNSFTVPSRACKDLASGAICMGLLRPEQLQGTPGYRSCLTMGLGFTMCGAPLS